MGQWLFSETNTSLLLEPKATIAETLLQICSLAKRTIFVCIELLVFPSPCRKCITESESDFHRPLVHVDVFSTCDVFGSSCPNVTTAYRSTQFLHNLFVQRAGVVFTAKHMLSDFYIIPEAQLVSFPMLDSYCSTEIISILAYIWSELRTAGGPVDVCKICEVGPDKHRATAL